MGIPIPLETMVAYGTLFSTTARADLENKTVVALDQSSKGFLLQLDNGETVTARRVLLQSAVATSATFRLALPICRRSSCPTAPNIMTLVDFKRTGRNRGGRGASALDLAGLAARNRCPGAPRRTTAVAYVPPQTRARSLCIESAFR